MSPYLAEFIGTMILILLGNGVCANVNLNKTLGKDSGWIVVTTGWALAVTFAVYLTIAHSGAHINPAVTIALLVIGSFDIALVPGYLIAQMAGAITGACLVWLAYRPHWDVTDDSAKILGSFSTGPAIPDAVSNFCTEAIGTFVLVLGVLGLVTPENLLPNTGFKEAVAPCLVGMTVWIIGLALGGPTGYAINPARDLGPRIAHAFLPMKNKGSSNWSYAWIPVAGPTAGGVAAALVYQALFPQT